MSEARVWDRLSGHFDPIVRPFDTSEGCVRERLARHPAEGSLVLEIAAGTGQFTLEIARL